MRPLADCFVHQFLPIGVRFCPTLDIHQEIKKLLNLGKFMIPLYIEDQEVIGNILIDPLPMPVSQHLMASSYYVHV